MSVRTPNCSPATPCTTQFHWVGTPSSITGGFHSLKRSSDISIGNLLLDEGLVELHAGQDIHDTAAGIAIAIGVGDVFKAGHELVGDHMVDGLLDGEAIMGHIHDIASALAALLTHADVHDRDLEGAGLDDAT